MRCVNRLRLNGPDLVPHFIKCLSNLLAVNLQMYAFNRPDLELDELIRVAISLEKSRPYLHPQPHVQSHQRALSHQQHTIPRSSSHQDPREMKICEYHGVGDHNLTHCSVLAAQVQKVQGGSNQFCNYHGWGDHASAVSRKLLRYPSITYGTHAHGRNHQPSTQFPNLIHPSNHYQRPSNPYSN